METFYSEKSLVNMLRKSLYTLQGQKIKVVVSVRPVNVYNDSGLIIDSWHELDVSLHGNNYLEIFCIAKSVIEADLATLREQMKLLVKNFFSS